MKRFMKRFGMVMWLVFCLAMCAMMTACAGHQQKTLTPQEQAQLIPQPFVMAVGGNKQVVHNFAEFSQMLQQRPLAFVTYIREDQYNAAYHLHLRSVFTNMGYTQMDEGFVEVADTNAQANQLAQQVTSNKRRGRARTVEVPKSRYYKQTYSAGMNQQTMMQGQQGYMPNGQRVQQQESSTGEKILQYLIPVGVVGIGALVYGLSR